MIADSLAPLIMALRRLCVWGRRTTSMSSKLRIYFLSVQQRFSRQRAVYLPSYLSYRCGT